MDLKKEVLHVRSAMLPSVMNVFLFPGSIVQGLVWRFVGVLWLKLFRLIQCIMISIMFFVTLSRFLTSPRRVQLIFIGKDQFLGICKSHNSKPPKSLTNNEAMDGGIVSPKKVVQKLETQLFWGEKFGRFLIHSGQTLSKLAFQSYSRFVVVRESTMAYSWGWWTPIGEWTCRMKKIGKFSQLKLKESVHFYI